MHYVLTFIFYSFRWFIKLDFVRFYAFPLFEFTFELQYFCYTFFHFLRSHNLAHNSFNTSWLKNTSCSYLRKEVLTENRRFYSRKVYALYKKKCVIWCTEANNSWENSFNQNKIIHILNYSHEDHGRQKTYIKIFLVKIVKKSVTYIFDWKRYIKLSIFRAAPL